MRAHWRWWAVRVAVVELSGLVLASGVSWLFADASVEAFSLALIGLASLPLAIASFPLLGYGTRTTDARRAVIDPHAVARERPMAAQQSEIRAALPDLAFASVVWIVAFIIAVGVYVVT